METPPAPTPMSCFYTSLRSRLHYLDWGNSSAPTLILMHGRFDHAHSWDWTARALAKDYHIVAPDLRGHGNSAWSTDGGYTMTNYVYDLAQLIETLGRSPVILVGHSFGGAVSLRFAGLYPDKVSKIVAIEGLGLSPQRIRERKEKPLPDQWREWLENRQDSARRTPRRYPTIESAVARMRERNDNLSVSQAFHLTVHGMNRNEDGSYSWKFDPYLHGTAQHSGADADLPDFWNQIRCPALLCLGLDSWATNPVKDGRAAHFPDARLAEFPDAGHWLHHDQFDRFIAELRAFL